MCFLRSEVVYSLWLFFKIRVLLDKQGFKRLNIFILIKIQSDSLESPCVLLSRCLRSPGLQSIDVRFPNRPVYFRGSEVKARAGRDEEHSWSVANGSCLCKAREAVLSSASSCATIKVIIPNARGRSALSLTAETGLEKRSVFRSCSVLDPGVQRCRWCSQWEKASW